MERDAIDSIVLIEYDYSDTCKNQLAHLLEILKE